MLEWSALDRGNERNPVEGCSWWSFLTFAWLTPTLQAGPRDGPRSHPVHHKSTRTACGARAVETRGDFPSGWLTWVPSQPGGRIEADCALETCAMSAGPIHGNHAAVAENMRFGGAGSVIAGKIARCGDADAQGAAAAGVGQHRGARVGLRARHRGPRQRPRAREPPRARSLTSFSSSFSSFASSLARALGSSPCCGWRATVFTGRLYAAGAAAVKIGQMAGGQGKCSFS